jgi:hypothetical protein
MAENIVQATNPLEEVDPKSLDELFARDPMFLTLEDRATIVKALRAMRTKWKASGENPKKMGAEGVKKLSIQDLDIQI